MRIILLSLLLFICIITSAQKNKLSINVFYRPEITNYKDSISFRWKEKTPRHGLSSFGFRILPEYRFTSRFLVRSGVGYINRVFKDNAFFNQDLLGDSTRFLFNSRKIEYRIIEFPIAAGYSIYSRNNIEAKIIGELSFNYLLNAYYHPVTYAGQYKKQYWLGKSFSGLLSCNYSVNTNLKLSVEAGYSFMNETKNDIFLFSQDEPVIGIEHRYFPVLVGLNYTFR